LNPIMAAAYLLEANAENPTAVRDYAVRIAKAAETGAATAARVGRFIRQEPLQGVRDELVDLETVCDEVVAMPRPLRAERGGRGGRRVRRRAVLHDLGRDGGGTRAWRGRRYRQASPRRRRDRVAAGAGYHRSNSLSARAHPGSRRQEGSASRKDATSRAARRG